MDVDNNNNNSSKPLTFVPERMGVEEFHQRCDEMGLAYKRLEDYIADATQQVSQNNHAVKCFIHTCLTWT